MEMECGGAVRRVDLDPRSFIGVCERVSCALAPIFVAFDRSDNELLNGLVVYMIRCLDKLDIELGSSSIA